MSSSTDTYKLMNTVCEQPDLGRNEETALFLKFAGLLSVIPIFWIMLYVYGAALCKKGELADSDCYMRLLRVEALHDGGPWYDPVVRRENAPYGQTSHWTRPFDVVLLLGAVPVGLSRMARQDRFLPARYPADRGDRPTLVLSSRSPRQFQPYEHLPQAAGRPHCGTTCRR